jgi:putative FmdB family regulatory protein
MPIHEFYCPDCHRVYNFLARRPNVKKRPDCPRCTRPKLERKISKFAISKGLTEAPDGPDGMDLPPGLDEAKMERALAEMAGEAENINEDDPRQMARMMRKLYDGTGLRLGEGMEEAMRRMEAGEDPDTIEAEMGDLLEDDDMLFGPGRSGLRGMTRRFRPPEVDETLYDL